MIPRWLRHALRAALQVFFDGAAAVLAYRAAYEIRFHSAWWTSRFPVIGSDPGWPYYIPALYAFVPLWLAIFWRSSQLYTRPWRLSEDRFLAIVKGAIWGALLTLSVSYVYDRVRFSRQMLLLAVPLITILVSLSEALALWLDRRIARWEATSPLVIVGGGKVAELVRQNLRQRHPGMEVHDLPAGEGAAAVAQKARSAGASEVILVRPPAGHAAALEIAEACESAGMGFKMIPDILDLRMGEIQMDDSLGLPAYKIQHMSLSPANRLVKRMADLAICAAVLLIAGAPGLLVAFLIKLDSPGPVLYKQKRLGYKSRVFGAFKFRTMEADAEKKLDEVRKTGKERGGFFKMKDDPRVTRVGRFLRRYSLDEFPQFLNVLEGTMSVVGPRPLAVSTGEFDSLLDQFGATAKKRFNILPGITGLWQVSGRSDVSSEQRFALDLFYIEHWSLGLDLQILLKTVPAMLAGKGAY